MWAPQPPGDPEKSPHPEKPAKTTRVMKKDKPNGKPNGKPLRPSVPPGKRRTWVTVVKWLAIAGLSGLLLMIATVAFVFWMYGRDKDLPDPQKLSDFRHRQVTIIVDKNDHRIGELFGRTKGEDIERRAYVEYDKVPKILVAAFVATEDTKFWEHSGVDYWGMFRAFWANLRSGKAKQGASTITQQVVKNLLLTPEKTFKRKIQEIILARRLEKSLTKEEILTLYMNQINFGNGRYGVQEAARFYFGKDVSQLDVGECALLAGLPQSPENYAPNRKKNQAKAKERQVHVLNRLVEAGKLTPAEAQKWIDKPIQYVENPFPYLNTAPEWVGMVRSELVASKCGGKGSCPEGELYLDTLGATVRTTLDPQIQATAQKALQTGLRAVDKRKSIGRAKRTAKDKDAELAKLTKALPKTGPVKGETYEALVTEVFDDDHEVKVNLGNYEAALVVDGPDDERFNPPDDKGVTKKPSERFKPGDVVDVVVTGDKQPPKHAAHRVVFPKGPEGAVVVMEVKTRKVRALVGGYASKTLGLNRATDAHRQPGSSFKPYVMAAGIDLGATKAKDQGGRITFTPASSVNDAPEPRWEEKWNAKNYESGKFEGDVLLRYALAKSINTVAIRVLERVTPQKIIDLAHAMGVQSQLPSTLSLALGAGEVTPLEHTNALATLAAGGQAAPPVFIDSIDGKAPPPPETTQVMKPEVAYVTLDMMRSVVTSGTGIQANKLGITIAGKTGTSNDAKDVWFIGLTPDYAIGVWIGFDDPTPMGKETGGTTAVPVFVDIAKGMGLKNKPFQRPPHVVEARIDKKSGLLAPEGAPADSVTTEVFVEGTVPTETAALEGDVTEQNQVKKDYE
ncbi:MAG TPA: PBP1A family penicillin-binding protein [Kofleriaceae bacterium]|nr:PBP1A family penicillin-binding protein [Kofleriaceae bacterium]